MRYSIAEFDGLPAVDCPCGKSKRAFADEPDSPASMHVVEISTDAATHYHKKMTEIYYFLEGEGYMELDGKRLPVRPGMAVMIRPLCRHRAVGRFKIINVAIPAFNSADEYLD